MAAIVGLALVVAGVSPRVPAAEPARQEAAAWKEAFRARVEQSLDKWCRWLAGYVRPVPDSDLFTLTPKLKTGPAYRDVAGNQFAAAAAGYWLARTEPEAEVARPLQGLIKLALGSHAAVQTVNRPEVPRWGATVSEADDWHADLFAATSGMLLLPGLPVPECQQLQAILAWEADKQAEYGISAKWRSLPGRWPAGSVGESNAWSTALLQAARVAWPDSSRQEVWRNTAIDYSLNSICLPDDLVSDRGVAGRPVKERVKGANFEPGGIQEHHGFYHPGYVGWPLAYQAFAELMDQQLPPSCRNPDVYLHHWKEAFDRLKQSTFANGRFIHCAGDDWNAYGYGNDHILPVAVFAAAQFCDPGATRLADAWLKLMERAQSLTGGPIQGARLARLQHGYSNDFAWYEAISGATLAHTLWVLDRLPGVDLPPPCSADEYDARNVGTYHEPNARLIWHRDRQRWASFCWRSAFGEWQAVVQPIQLPHLLKFNHNSIGVLEAENATAGAKLQWHRIETLPGGGFWSLGAVDRLAAKDAAAGSPKGAFLVRQHQALIALPEGPSLLIDQCQALHELRLVRSAGLGLRLAADIFNDHQVRLSIDGAEHAFGLHADRDTWQDLRTRSVTIEKLLTIQAASGEGSFQLLQKRCRPADHSSSPYPHDPRAVEESLLSHELYFGPPGCDQRETIAPQTWFRNMILVIYCDPQQAPPRPAAVVTGRPPCVAVELPEIGRTVAVNFESTEQSVDSPCGPFRVASQSVTVCPVEQLP
jgi:hypothetical protein